MGGENDGGFVVIDKKIIGIAVATVILLSCVIDYLGAPKIRFKHDGNWFRELKIGSSDIEMKLHGSCAPSQFEDNVYIVIEYKSLGEKKINLTSENFAIESNCCEIESPRWGIVDYKTFVVHLNCKHKDFNGIYKEEESAEYRSRFLRIIVKDVFEKPRIIEVKFVANR